MVAVVMSTLPKHFEPCIQSLWMQPNLKYLMVSTALTEYDLRHSREHGLQVKQVEAMAAEDLSLPLTVDLGKSVVPFR
jgi:hypothetical protein